MKRIPLDAVLEILTKVSTRSHIPNVIDAVMEIPTINPFATIDEMIEYRNETERRWLYLSDNEDYARSVLQELKSRLLITQK